MAIKTRKYGEGTYLTQSFPWGVYVGGRAKCSDGKVRTLSRIAQTADTFFSVPATVKVKGRSVAGYISLSDEEVVTFHAYTYRKNGGLLA